MEALGVLAFWVRLFQMIFGTVAFGAGAEYASHPQFAYLIFVGVTTIIVALVFMALCVTDRKEPKAALIVDLVWSFLWLLAAILVSVSVPSIKSPGAGIYFAISFSWLTLAWFLRSLYLDSKELRDERKSTSSSANHPPAGPTTASPSASSVGMVFAPGPGAPTGSVVYASGPSAAATSVTLSPRPGPPTGGMLYAPGQGALPAGMVHAPEPGTPSGSVVYAPGPGTPTGSVVHATGPGTPIGSEVYAPGPGGPAGGKVYAADAIPAGGMVYAAGPGAQAGSAAYAPGAVAPVQGLVCTPGFPV